MTVPFKVIDNLFTWQIYLESKWELWSMPPIAECIPTYKKGPLAQLVRAQS